MKGEEKKEIFVVWIAFCAHDRSNFHGNKYAWIIQLKRVVKTSLHSRCSFFGHTSLAIGFISFIHLLGICKWQTYFYDVKPAYRNRNYHRSRLLAAIVVIKKLLLITSCSTTGWHLLPSNEFIPFQFETIWNYHSLWQYRLYLHILYIIY